MLPYRRPHYGLDWVFVWAARQSTVKPFPHYDKYLRTPEADGALIEYLIDNEHMSPFEMVQTHWHVEVPYFIARQWMRHRTWSYNEASLRYQTYNEEQFGVHIPEMFRLQHPNNKQASGVPFSDDKIRDEIIGHTAGSIELYHKLIGDGVCREQARMVLPLNTMTCFVGSVNYRNLLHFLELRLHEGAQQEFREVAASMYWQIEYYFPLSLPVWKANLHASSRDLLARTDPQRRQDALPVGDGPHEDPAPSA